MASLGRPLARPLTHPLARPIGNALTTGVAPPIEVAFNDPIVGIGDSWMAGERITSGVRVTRSAGSFMAPLMALAGSYLRMPIGGNLAVGGSSIATIKGQVDDALALGAKVIVVGTAGINSVVNDVSAASILADLAEIKATANAGGAIVAIPTIAPTFAPYGELSAPREAVRQAVNAGILAMASANCVVADCGGQITSGAQLNDGLHTNRQGAIDFARPLAAALKARLASAAGNVLGLLSTGTNWVNNLQLSGNSGSGVATGQTLNTSASGGATVTPSKTAGDDKQRIDVSGTYSGTGRNWYLQNTGSGGAPAAGQTIETIMVVEMLSEPTQMFSVTNDHILNDSGFANVLASTSEIAGLLPSDGPVAIRGPLLTAPSGAMYTINQVFDYFTTVGGSTAIDHQVKLHGFGVHRVS